MANAAMIVPEDMADVFNAMSQDCGTVQRQWIGDAVEQSLRQQSISFDLRDKVRRAIQDADAEQLPECFSHPKLWVALRAAFKDRVAVSNRPMGLPATLLSAINHLSR